MTEESSENRRTTAVMTDDAFLEHDTGPGHPERADRLRAVASAISADPPGNLAPISAREASREELERVHRPEHVAAVAASAARGRFSFDADTPTSPGSHRAATLAAGGTLELVDAVLADRAENGFAFVRPPGHHAEADHPMGFCLFNNVALAAAHLRERHGLERVLVVDWDVHHGNGTQHSFESRRDVLFVSSHQYPFYPGTGAARDVGSGEGEGFTLNVPLPAGCGDGEYVDAFQRIVEPVARTFDPEFILVSAGFDAHRRDPLAEMHVTEDGFAELARMLLRVADEHCNGRLVAVLEGGYDLEALGRSVRAVLDVMSGRDLDAPRVTSSSPAPIETSLEVARHYWG